jgi:hypothetical protein
MTKPSRAIASALFVTDRELHQWVAPNIGWDRFRAAVKKMEADGFPQPKELMGGRYWPAVKEWLDSHYGFVADGALPVVEDGPETFDATPRHSARPENRPHPERRDAPAVLDRTPSRARPDGLSGQVHSAASRR